MQIKLNNISVNTLIFCSYLFAHTCWAESQFFGLMDMRLVDSDAEENALNGGLTPHRVDESDDVILGQALLFGVWQMSDAFSVRGLASVYDDDGDDFGVGELYVKYRPAPASEYRIEAKVGSFFPEISLENTRAGWTSKNPLTNSAINTWIGEEVRITGVQFSLARLGSMMRDGWDFSASTSIFISNDPTGALLTWRGWALHDRQLRLGEEIKIAPLPTIGTETGFTEQRPYYEPFLEVDDKPGYTFSLSTKHQSGFRLKYYRYDNRADPEAIRDGQYGWRTKFDHIGLSYTFPTSTRIFSQWMSGSTLMGNRSEEYVHADFESWYLGVMHSMGSFNISLRYDDFEVVNIDNTPMDNNDQEGDAWVLGVRYDVSNSIGVISEYSQVSDKNYVRTYFSRPVEETFRLFQTAIQWRF